MIGVNQIKQFQKQRRKKKVQKYKGNKQINIGTFQIKRSSSSGNIQQIQFKNKIMKQFCLLNKQQISLTQLKWLLLTCGYSNHQIKQLISRNRILKKQDNISLNFQKVWQLCRDFSPKGKWKKECFDLFSNDKKNITLLDLQGAWDSMNISQKRIVSHETLIELTNSFGFETFGSINFQQFEKLLDKSNRFLF